VADRQRKRGDAVGQDDRFGIPMDESARAARTIDDPVAYVQEFMTVVTTLLSQVLGLPPEQFYALACVVVSAPDARP
jgi:hypothetical protein